MAEVRINQNPSGDVEHIKAPLAKEFRQAMGDSLMGSVEAALSDRSDIEENLKYWNDLYEMNVPQRNWPWIGASNVFVPLIPTQVDTLTARLSGLIFQPRFYLINGNTPEAAQVQHEVERYYNAELQRHQWVEDHYNWLHLALRDGTSIMEILWSKRTKKMKVAVMPKPDPQTTTDTMFPGQDDTSKAKAKPEIREIIVTDYDDVELTPLELRDFLIIPAWQGTIEDASAVARAKLMSEEELFAMCKGEKGVMWKDAVEQALSYVHEGQSDLAADKQGTESRQAGGQVDIGGEEGNDSAPFKRIRGPVKVWRVHTRQYDMDGDGTPEENVFWVHESSRILLGYDTYHYWHGERPFVELTPMPRPSQFYGFSIPERLRTLQEELNSIHNQRNDQIDLRLSPPMYYLRGARINDQEGRWGPTARYELDTPQDVGLITLQDVPVSSWQEEGMLEQMAEKLTGLSAPQLGGQTSSRRSAKEAQMASQSAGVRLDLMAARIRQSAKRVLFQIHQLKLQYGPDTLQTDVNIGGQPKRLEMDKHKLMLDFDMSIAGMGGPLDKTNRMQETMGLYALLTKNPLVMNNQLHMYYVTRMVLEEMNRSDIQNLIGSPEEIMQQMQAQQQQAQMQQAAQQLGGQPGGPQQPHSPAGPAPSPQGSGGTPNAGQAPPGSQPPSNPHAGT